MAVHQTFVVMAGLVPAIHVLLAFRKQRRGCPAQGRAWRTQIQI